MRNKGKICALLMATAMLFTGCFSRQLDSGVWKLPANASSYDCEHNKDTGLDDYTINGRNYSSYGHLDGTLDDESIRECLGYVDSNRDMRIYSLANDPYDNYLMVCNVKDLSLQPVFLRDGSTYGEDIFTPIFIEPDGDESWGDSGVEYEMKAAVIGLICDVEDIKYIDYEYDINGQTGGVGQTGYLGGRIIDKGELFEIEIPEVAIKDKFPTDEPFDISLTLTVTDADDNVHEVRGVYERTMALTARLNGLELRHDDEGYYLFEDV